jgi:uncharacterized protein YqiB (DUF1249 family)
MVYASIFKNLSRVIPGLLDLKPGDYLRLEAPGFMPLAVDCLARESDGTLVVAIAHNFIQNGDVCPDPDMQIRVLPPREFAGTSIPGYVEALTYQDMTRYEEVYTRDARAFRPALKKSLNSFLLLWSKNLIQQGHALPAVEAA